MSTSRSITRFFAVVLVLCLAGSIVTLRRLDSLRASATLEEVLYLPSARVLRYLSLGYTGLLSNLYWTRTVQYFGRKHGERAARFDLLPKLLEITTELDPHLVVAYKYGSIFLAQEPPEGAGRPDLAVDFVERGIRANPGDWQLYYHLGFVHFIERKDYIAAAEAFRRGSEVPGAHPWMKVMAAAMAQFGGDRETARRLWTYIYQSTEDEYIRANAVKRLRALEVDDAVPRLEERIRLYRERTGQWPESWQQMIADGFLRGIPLDPLGLPYKLMPEGRVEVRKPEDLPFIRHGLPQGLEPSLFAVPDKAKEDKLKEKEKP